MSNSSQGKYAGVGGPPLPIGTREPSTPPHIAYYTLESAYYTPYQPTAGISPTINPPPPPFQHQWTGKTTFQHQGKQQRKRVRNGSQYGGRQPVQFSHSPNIAYQHQSPPYQSQKPIGGRGDHRERHQWRCGGEGNMQATHTKKTKLWFNKNTLMALQ